MSIILCEMFIANVYPSQEKKRMVEATPDEMVAQLEVARSELVTKKTGLERKLSQLSERKERESRDTK